ncbi:MAG TPA: glycosyltransferase family 4 protein, partial [Bacteroidales bacterium]|nr:glycosyltransferase family 4 protein [Bacteroidales bacterium]
TKVKLPENFSIKWLGYLQKSEVARVLNNSGFFLHASELETFSIVTAEALATGTPVMVSNIGALPELVNENNGLLVENNLHEWIAGLKRIIKINYNKKEIAEKIAFKYSPESIAEKINSVYKSLTS